MEAGAEVWIRDSIGNEAWVAGVVLSKTEISDSQVTIHAKSYEGDDFSFRVEKGSKDVDNLKLRNNEEDLAVDDLINLTHLHEPAMLYCLQERYFRSQIYTYTGPILIAVNPFKRVESLYTAAVLEQYYNSGLLRAQGAEIGSVLSPHVYAIADAAYRDMMKIVLHGYGAEKEKTRAVQHAPANQSILISGESGAGKTESTKIVLKYLTTVGQGDDEKGMVMERILHSNPILEAFGNARTLRNDNSSRFGKFIELNFSKRGVLIGGSIRTYLLEKVRLPIQQKGERNFHVFYQLFEGASDEEKDRWGLTAPEDFAYISCGGVFRLQHVDDAVEYLALRRALDTLNFEAESQRDLFDVVAGVLHLGQISFAAFNDGEGEGSNIDVNKQSSLDSVRKVCLLLGLTEKNLSATLCTRHIVVGGENFLKKLSAAQASDARDALAKAIYAKIFDWIVRTINLSIRVDSNHVRANIGVLDIFGFESFVNNSFEQLCINYTNETLQQQFNQYIFKMEQQEYQRECIEWSFIEFPDNKDCLDLIEHKLNGILVMIDDECRLPKASDEKLAGRMYKAFESHQRFSASIVQRRDFKFSIHHYAGSVEYSTLTFVEKNKDELPKEAYNLLQSSSNALLQSIFSENKAILEKQKGRSSKMPSSVPASMGFQFKEQLASLMETIYATSPHYIRCLKPNDANEPDNFHRLRITEQLRYGGVLEAVRVARSGFPVRFTHGEFLTRYRLALPLAVTNDDLSSPNHKEACETFVRDLHSFFSRLKTQDYKVTHSLLQRYLDFCGTLTLQEESIQIGLNKVFLRKTSYDILESMRFRRCTLAAISLQSAFRGFRVCRNFTTLRWAALSLQRIFRGMLSRRHVRIIRMTAASLRLQRFARSTFTRKRYLRLRKAVVLLQSLWRHKVAVEILFELRKGKMVLLLQRAWRMWIHRNRFRKFLGSVVVLQNKIRKVRAVRLLRQLRLEARDLGKLKQSNDLLKQEIELIKQRAAEEKERLRKELEERTRQDIVHGKDTEIELLRKRVEEHMMMLESERRLKISLEQKLQALNDATPMVCSTCNKLRQELKDRESIIHKLQLSISRDQKQLLTEEELQEILSTKSILEQENSRLRKQSIEQQVLLDNLQSQLEKGRRPSSPSLPDRASRVSSFHSPLPMKDHAINHMGRVTRKSEEDETRTTLPAELDAAQDPLTNSFRDAEKKTSVWKAELRQGFRVILWESSKSQGVEVVAKLDPTGRILQFLITNRRTFSFLQSKSDVAPLRIIDIEQCSPGSFFKADALNPMLTLTIHCGTRRIVLRFNSTEERNTTLSKLRAIVSSEILIESNVLQSTRNVGEISLNSMKENAMASTTGHAQRATRRLTVRETILEGNLASMMNSSVQIAEKSTDPIEHLKSLRELRDELKAEREQKEKLKLQLLLTSNELVEKDELIAKMKHRESTFEHQLQEKDRLYKQDMMVRLQLGKRLEQVLFDKEEALEELEQLKIQLDNIKSSLK